MAAMLLSFLLLLMSPAVAPAQPQQTNITSGSSLSLTDNPPAWFSPSGRFAFGFYPQSTGFKIGVWLVTTPDKTIVWTASRDEPPVSGGTIRLTFDGRLTWTAPGGMGRSISEAGEPGVSASVLDSGNFVLYNSKNQIIWSTFDTPTDTILAGQKLIPGKQLFSSSSETDGSTGKFRLNMQMDGNLVLYPVQSTDTATDGYWDTGTFQIGFPLTLNLNSEGTMYLTGNNNSYNIAHANSTISKNKAEIYYLAKLDVDGILRLYSYSFDRNGTSTKSVEWEVLKDSCLVKGTCGLNSYCNSSSNGELLDCLCPPGFDYVNPNQRLLGCIRSFNIGRDCDGKGEDNSGFSISTMEGTLWADQPYSILSTDSMEECKTACLRDCFCEAALFQEGKCRKQNLPLKYGRSNVNYTSFIKAFATSTPSKNSGAGVEEISKVRLDVLILCVAVAVFSVVIFSIFALLLYRRRRAMDYENMAEKSNSALDEETFLRSFSYEELERATGGFKEELGKGSFGTVFKGILLNGERTIAVKRLEKMVEEGEREFQRELRAIGRTHHRNLVRLLGFCNEGSNRLLVYEFMSNGSLGNLLFKQKPRPACAERVSIAIDIAKGLQYLHEDLESQIIHCDIKPQNILMDDNWNAKISDFGLAKLLMPDQTRTFTGVRGTRGYLAPEWHKNTPITVKTDVYSFGVVLLEIVCCRRNMELEEAGDDVTLAEWVYECLAVGDLGCLSDDQALDMAELERMAKVGIWCVQDDPAFRPSMKNVILMLEGSLNVSIPPRPVS